MNQEERTFEEKRLDLQENLIKHSLFGYPEIMQEIRGVIQLGAAYGEQIPNFQHLPIQIYFEPVPRAYKVTKAKLELNEVIARRNLKAIVHNVAIGEKSGKVKFHQCGPNNSNSSSILPFSKVATDYNPKLVTEEEYEVEVWSLDDFISRDEDAKKCNLLFMDTQGYEGYVLRGAANTISQFDYVYTEVNHIPLYEGTILFKDFNEAMLKKGFVLVDLVPLVKSTGSQSNALYKRIFEVTARQEVV